MEDVPVDGFNLVAVAQTGLLCGVARLHLGHLDGARHVLRLHAGIADVEVFCLGRQGYVERQGERLAAAVHNHGNILAGVQLDLLVDLRLPGRVVDAVEAADDVAGLDPCLGRGRAGSHPLHDRVLHRDRWHLVEEGVIKEHQHQGQQKVHCRSGQSDEHALPAGMGSEGRRIRGNFVSGFLGEVLARHLHKSAQREQADLVVGIAVLEAEQARPEAEGEGFDANAAKLGRNKMAQLVQNHDQSDKDDEGSGRNQKFMHRWTAIPSAMRGLRL